MSNAAPVLAGLTQPGGAALPATVVVAQSLDLRALFTDPGENDTHVAELDCGEGYGPPAPVDSPFDRTCTFGAVGPRTIRVRVTDDDGAAAVRTHALTVTYNVEGFFEPVARSSRAHAVASGAGDPAQMAGDRLRREGRSSDCRRMMVTSAGQACGGWPGVLGTRKNSRPARRASKDLGDGRYQFVWKTSASYAGSCRAVSLQFAPGYATGPLGWFAFKP